MTEVHIITPPGMFGATASDDVIDTAMRVIGVGFGDPDEWPSKYGTNYENDVFMMHRFCWCDKEGECPWCTGCGAYEEACSVCSVDYHSGDCYSKELAKRLRAAGLEEYDYEKRKDVTAIKRILCKERGVKFTEYLFFCDCGGDERRNDALKTGGCDYHRGTGIFSRFAPWTLDHKRHYYDPPNFWFKPTDFRLTWYKYIGRDMASNKDEIAGDFLQRVFASHPKGMTVEAAFAEFTRREEESAEAFATMFKDLGVKMSG